MRSRNTFLPPKQKARLNAPPEKEPWVWLTQELLSSDAFRSLSITAYRVLFRLIIEHTKHAGLENGRLKVTYYDFECYGCRLKSIKKAIEELVAAGLIQVTTQGRRCHGQDHGSPSEYRLTWLPVGTESDFQPATNGWKAAKPKQAGKIFPLLAICPVASTGDLPSMSRGDLPSRPRGAASTGDLPSTLNIFPVGKGSEEQTRTAEPTPKKANGADRGHLAPKAWHKPAIVEIWNAAACLTRTRKTAPSTLLDGADGGDQLPPAHWMATQLHSASTAQERGPNDVTRFSLAQPAQSPPQLRLSLCRA